VGDVVALMQQCREFLAVAGVTYRLGRTRTDMIRPPKDTIPAAGNGASQWCSAGVHSSCFVGSAAAVGRQRRSCVPTSYACSDG
jgi:hypothetical protein